ncbi:hypothetical protein RRF57_013173 [Xylaria bambusicola]|uniref:Uncharacterized protein n=1 Tax=Xylaria bambusicola TaxID=326684 RepID=A0AAN7V0H6_9PEZI
MEQATSIELFVEILDRYVYYFDQANEAVRDPPSLEYGIDEAKGMQVTTKYINGLIELIHSNLGTNQQDSASIENSKRHFKHTLENIASRQYEGIVLNPQK